MPSGKRVALLPLTGLFIGLASLASGLMREMFKTFCESCGEVRSTDRKEMLRSNSKTTPGGFLLPEKWYNALMEREVSIVLSTERRNYRKLAQEWFGLTDEQMVGMDVHHNPPRHQGGRNIPEHLFVYHNTLHYAVHSAEFILWNREAAKKGGEAVKNKGLGIFDLTEEQQREKNKKADETNRKNGTAVYSPGVSALGGIAAMLERDEDGKSIQARKIAAIWFEDPDHPELGKTNAGNLVRMQMRRGLPHGPKNRRRVE